MHDVMKKIQKKLLGCIAVVLVTVAVSGDAYAAACTTVSSSASSSWSNIYQVTGTCSRSTTLYYQCGTKYYKVENCMACASGTTRQSGTVAPGYITMYSYCSPDGSGGSSSGGLQPDLDMDLIDCTGECPVLFTGVCNSWVVVSQLMPMGGYEHAYQAKSTCECKFDSSQGKCAWVATETKYRCAKGFYGGASCSGTLQASCSGCQPCSSHDGSRGTTTPNDGMTSTTQVQACYKDETISSNDGKGTYVYTTPCYYSAN